MLTARSTSLSVCYVLQSWEESIAQDVVFAVIIIAIFIIITVIVNVTVTELSPPKLLSVTRTITLYQLPQVTLLCYLRRCPILRILAGET